MLSRSTRVVAVIAPYSAGSRLFTVESPILPLKPPALRCPPLCTDALSPLDGRYAGKLARRAPHIQRSRPDARARARGVRLVPRAGGGPARATRSPKLPPAARELLATLAQDPQRPMSAAIKQIEARTNHDVKAVEYWLRARAASRAARRAAQLEWMHFACTSEDINNLAYALMLKSARATRAAADAARLGAARSDALAQSLRRRRHAGAHPRADRDADDRRQGTRQRRRTPRARSAAASSASPSSAR